MATKWDGDLVDVGRLLLKNEENFRMLQRYMIEPISQTVAEHLHEDERIIIKEMAAKMKEIASGFSGSRISIPLNIREWQRSAINEKFLPPGSQTTLDLTFTRLHQLRFARGPEDRAELGDFVFHVEFIAPNDRYFGLSNFFQIKRVTDEACRVPIDTKQIRFWICPSTISYWDWDKSASVDLSRFRRYGEFSHYWFIHSSKEAHWALLTGGLAENARAWVSDELPHAAHWTWLAPRLIVPFGVELSSSVPAKEVANLLLSSCASSTSVMELLATVGAEICTADVSNLMTEQIHLLRHGRLVAPLYPTPTTFVDCTFLRHGVDADLLRHILLISREKGPKKEAELSGLAIILKLRFGGEEVKSKSEIGEKFFPGSQL